MKRMLSALGLLSAMGRAIAVLLLLVLGPGAFAQAVIQADGALIQPQIYRDGPTINGCGQRIVLSSVVSEKEVYIADFSVSVRIDIQKQTVWALTKAGIYRHPQKGEVLAKNLKPIESYFISSPDGSVALVPEKFFKGDTPGFLLGGGESGPATELMWMMLAGQRTQFGIRLRSEGLARVYSFQPKISTSDAADFNECMKGFMVLVDKMLKELEEGEAKP